MKKIMLGCLAASALLLQACAAPPPDIDSPLTDSQTETSFADVTTAELIKEEPGTVVGFGTPTVDGKLDDAYKSSFAYSEEPLENLNYSASGLDTAREYMKNTRGTAYYLYDDEYLYICTVVKDETLCSRGEEWRMNTEWPWNDDGAEIYLWFSDEDCMAIHGDAHGIRAVVDEHIWGDNHSSARTYHDLSSEDFAASIAAESSEYTVEMRVKLPDYVKAGSTVGTLLEIDDRWAVGDGTDKLIGALFAMPRFPGAENFHVKLGEAR